jgi:hypothetical protein
MHHLNLTVRGFLLASLTLLCLMGIGSPGFAQDAGPVSEDARALDAQASRLDPEDYKSVKAVCTVCHSPSMFLHSRPWDQWIRVFDDMSRNGARGTQEEWDHISRYFQTSLTILDVNSSPEDEIAAVLEVSDDTANKIVAHRAVRKFTGMADLEAMPGVDKNRVESVGPRLSF